MQTSAGPLLLRGWVAFLVVAAAMIAGSAVWAAMSPTVYRSSAVVAVTPKGDRPVTAAVVMLTAPRFVAYATSPYVLRQVAVQQRLDSADLRNDVVVTMAASTANITITATAGEPDTATRVAAAIATAVLRRADSDPILGAQIVSGAVQPTAPSGPDRPAVIGAGALAGLVAGIVAWFLVERHHRRRRAVVVRGVAVVGMPTVDAMNTVPESGQSELDSVAELTKPLSVLDDDLALEPDPMGEHATTDEPEGEHPPGDDGQSAKSDDDSATSAPADTAMSPDADALAGGTGWDLSDAPPTTLAKR